MSKACSLTFFFLGIAFISQNASAQEPKPDVDVPLFNYLQPAKWGDIGVGTKLCSNGTQQSPINIEVKNVVLNKELPPLRVVYRITGATLMTNGIVPQLVVKGNSELLVGGKSVKLVNLRWHTPAEHTFDGQIFVAELQQMYVSDNGGVGKPDVIIVSTIYKIGTPDPIVAALEPEMGKLAKGMDPKDENKQLAEEVPVDKIAGDLLNKIPTTNYISYAGSITIPPCLEGVTWILTDPQSMTLEQAKLINSLRSKSNEANCRPVQPLNGRQIQANFK